MPSVRAEITDSNEYEINQNENQNILNENLMPKNINQNVFETFKNNLKKKKQRRKKTIPYFQKMDQETLK